MTVKEIRRFGNFSSTAEVPNLSHIQLESYDRFLQGDVPADKRQKVGLEGLLQEIFPIVSYDERTKLEDISYELGKTR